LGVENDWNENRKRSWNFGLYPTNGMKAQLVYQINKAEKYLENYREAANA
jgi:hypothetical protein